MTLKKVSLWGATFSVAMLGASTSALAVPAIYDPLAAPPLMYPPSALNPPAAPVFPFRSAERGAICLSEALLSTVAAHISAKGCAQAAAGGTLLNVDNTNNATGAIAAIADDEVASFPVTIKVDTNGKGTLTMSGGVGGLTNIELDNELVDVRATRGVKCLLSSPKSVGQYTLQGTPFNGFEGLMTWNSNSAVLIGQAPKIGIGKDWYAETIVKDFYNLKSITSPYVPRGPVAIPPVATVTNPVTLADIQLPGNPNGAAILAVTAPENINGDWGLEAIMKHPYSGETYDDLGYPRSKWWQQSLHWNANGVGGGTQMKKTRLYPTYCNVELNVWGSDFASGFNETGTLRITAATPSTAGIPPAEPNLGLNNP